MSNKSGLAMSDRLPPPPLLRALTAKLRDLHEAWSHPDAGGEWVALQYFLLKATKFEPAREWWSVAVVDSVGAVCSYGREYIPGDGAPFDATAAARRLLAAARDDRAIVKVSL
jgi:hypothetical protein